MRFVVPGFLDDHGGDSADRGSDHGALRMILNDCRSDGRRDSGAGGHKGGAFGGLRLFSIPQLGWKFVDFIELFESDHGLVHGAHDGVHVEVIFLRRRRIGGGILLLRLRLLPGGRRVLRRILLRVGRLRSLLLWLLLLILILRLLRLGERQSGSGESEGEWEDALHDMVFHLSGVDATGRIGFRKGVLKFIEFYGFGYGWFVSSPASAPILPSFCLIIALVE
jgi:hypothetical protein